MIHFSSVDGNVDVIDFDDDDDKDDEDEDDDDDDAGTNVLDLRNKDDDDNDGDGGGKNDVRVESLSPFTRSRSVIEYLAIVPAISLSSAFVTTIPALPYDNSPSAAAAAATATIPASIAATVIDVGGSFVSYMK